MKHHHHHRDRQNGRSSASCRASIAVTLVLWQIWYGSRWSMANHRRVSTPVKAAHHPSSWCRFVGSGLLVHHFEVWRRDRKDPVFAYGRCTKRRTRRYDAELHCWTRNRASWCEGCIVGTVRGKTPVYSSRLVGGSRSQSHEVGIPILPLFDDYNVAVAVMKTVFDHSHLWYKLPCR